MTDQYLDIEESFWTVTVKDHLLDEQLLKHGEDQVRCKLIRDLNHVIRPLITQRYAALIQKRFGAHPLVEEGQHDRRPTGT